MTLRHALVLCVVHKLLIQYKPLTFAMFHRYHQLLRRGPPVSLLELDKMSKCLTYSVTWLLVVLGSTSCSLVDYVGLVDGIFLVGLQLLVTVCLSSICVASSVGALLVTLNWDWTALLTSSGNVVVLNSIWLVVSLSSSKGAVLEIGVWSGHSKCLSLWVSIEWLKAVDCGRVTDSG